MSAFDRSDRFQQELPEILTAIAAPRVPDYADELLIKTAATRQRRRWTFVTTWRGIDALADRIAIPAIPWRPLLAAAVLIALLVAALLIAGSQQRVPPPFGPARNGAVLHGSGDIYIRDRIDGTSRLIIGGTSNDTMAGFTRDGQRVIFLRGSEPSGAPDSRFRIYTADPDGSNPTPVTEPMPGLNWLDFAPDDSYAVFAAGDLMVGQQLYVADLRHVDPPRRLDIGDPGLAAGVPNFLGPTGAEIVFRGTKNTPTGRRHGLFAVRPDGSGLRPLTSTDGTDEENAYALPLPSPNGRFLTYTVTDTTSGGLQIHVVDLQTGIDRNLTPVGQSEGWASFSPDSGRILYGSFVADRIQFRVAAVTGTGRPLSIGPSYRYDPEVSLGGFFSPDGEWVIVNDPLSGESRLVDASTGGDGDVLAWSGADVSGWQRLAP